MRIVEHVGNRIGLPHLGHGRGDRDGHRTAEGHEPLQREASAGDDFDQVIVGKGW